MFGGNNIYGQTDVKSDGKGRIVLPALTSAQGGDEVIVLKYDDKIKIVTIKSIEEEIEKIEAMILEEIDTAKGNALERKLYELYSSIYYKCIIDNQKRINISDIVEKDQVYRIIGCKNGIFLEKKDQKKKKIK